jgi:hypothetical protein
MDAFISHSSRDRDVAGELEQALDLVRRYQRT